jgi:tRNA threonylcarbamoyladenosine biosynthesis protein TsaE
MITTSVTETLKAGEAFAKTLEPNAVVLLYGEMGAGKTHFVKGMARGLGIDEVITSPTFALANAYDGLYHFDLFRIHTLDDLYAIGFYDYIGGGILAIEWADNIPEIKSEFDEYYTVKIKANPNEREITIDYIRA